MGRRLWLLSLLAPVAAVFVACGSFDATDAPTPSTDGGPDLETSIPDDASEASVDAAPPAVCNPSHVDPAPSSDCLGTGQAVVLSTSTTHCGRCNHSCLGGDCVNGACAPVRLSTLGAPFVNDVSATHVYFVTGSDVQRASLGNGAIDVVARFTTPQSEMRSLVRENDRLYVTAARTSSLVIGVVPDITKDSGVDTLLETTGYGVLAASTNDLFFLDYSSIYRVSKTGAASRSTVQANPETDAVVGPTALGNTLAWIVVQGPLADGGVPNHRLFLESGGTSVLRAENLGVAEAIALDATHVYWAERGKRIMRVARAGTSPPTVVAEWPGTNDYVKALTSTTDAVYWVVTPDGQSGADATIYGAPKCAENGNVVVAAHPGGEYLGLLVADATHLYYGGLSGIWSLVQ